MNVPVSDVEVDEVWQYIGKKQKRVRPEDDQSLGDNYVFVAIERHTKLVLNITIGERDQNTTNVFIGGLRDAIDPDASRSRAMDSPPTKTPSRICSEIAPIARC